MESISTNGLSEALNSVLGSLNLDGGDINLDKFKRDFAAKCFKEYNPLRQGRKKLDLTISNVASVSGLSKITVSNYESGYPQAASPSLPNLFVLFEAVSPYSEHRLPRDICDIQILGDRYDTWLSEQLGEYALWFRASMGDEEDMSEYVNERTSGPASSDASH